MDALATPGGKSETDRNNTATCRRVYRNRLAMSRVVRTPSRFSCQKKTAFSPLRAWMRAIRYPFRGRVEWLKYGAGTVLTPATFSLMNGRTMAYQKTSSEANAVRRNTLTCRF
jgi:hypothetical protein